jgi:hypothetical protein
VFPFFFYKQLVPIVNHGSFYRSEILPSCLVAGTMGCSPSKDEEYVEGVHTLMVPLDIPLDRLFFYLVSGQFHRSSERI